MFRRVSPQAGIHSSTRRVETRVHGGTSRTGDTMGDLCACCLVIIYRDTLFRSSASHLDRIPRALFHGSPALISWKSVEILVSVIERVPLSPTGRFRSLRFCQSRFKWTWCFKAGTMKFLIGIWKFFATKISSAAPAKSRIDASAWRTGVLLRGLFALEVHPSVKIDR